MRVNPFTWPLNPAPESGAEDNGLIALENRTDFVCLIRLYHINEISRVSDITIYEICGQYFNELYVQVTANLNIYCPMS